MAPEQVYSILAIDLEFRDGILEGDGERVELQGQPIYVTWYAADLQDGHVEVLNGLMQVPFDPNLARSSFVRKQPAELGNGYQWRDPAPMSGPLMFALLLPAGYTLSEASVRPTQAKVHKERLAVFWLLPEAVQVSLTWQLSPAAQALRSEAQRINRQSLDSVVQSRPNAGFIYDVALSFAGEDRPYVDEVARTLRDEGVRVFYDLFEEVTLWGTNLYDRLSKVYKEEARYTVMFISHHYVAKVWTRHERESAQARALRENAEYILPARFDDSHVPGLLDTTAYLPLNNRAPADVAGVIKAKVLAQ